MIFISGIARSFLQPARSALGAELVPRELYPNAVTWRSSTWQLAEVVGPAIGGLVYGFGSARAAYGVDAALMVVGVASLARVRHASRRPALQRIVPQSLATGIRFVRGQPVVLGALTLDLFSVLFGGAVALLPVFAAEILLRGPTGPWHPPSRARGGSGADVAGDGSPAAASARGRTLLVSVALFGLSMIGFGLSRDFLLSIALLAVSGMVDTVSVVVRSTLLQVLTPDHLFGRVAAVNAIFIGSSNEIGAFESGTAAKLLGHRARR